MPDISRNTPLAALEGMALDTETTGLDTRSARVIEIGAVAIGAGDRRFQSLVQPGVAVPATSTAVHGITSDMLAGAPTFPVVWPEVERFLGDSVLLGHSLGFDLAILERECARAGLRWRQHLWLDTRLLAILLHARLPDFSLATLATWLGIDAKGQHRAIGDAAATIAVFHAMVPRLREIGIHTVGEAISACRRLEKVTDDLARAGWAELPRLTAAERDTGERTDTYPYRHRVMELASAPPLFVGEAGTLGAALAIMAERRISSLFVGNQTADASSVGIVTERDVLRAIAKAGPAALDQPVMTFASRPLAGIPAGAYVYRAIGRMARLNIRHLAVIDEATGRVAGALSQRDLLKLRASAAVVLGDDVDQAADVAAMGRAWAKLPAMAQALVQEGLSGQEIAGIVARELGALTRRAAMLAEAELVAQGRPVPCPYAVLVLGSAGRGESLLAMDQDNAVVFAEGEPDGTADRWFAMFGERMCAMLHEAGVPLCTGGVMASQPAFRGSVNTWRNRMSIWLGRSSPQDLLNVDIVFDARAVHGLPMLASELMAEFRTAAMGSPAFLKLMTASHDAPASPIGLFGGLRGDAAGRLDLKQHVISRSVSAARVLALRHGVAAGSTAERLAGVADKGVGSAADLAGLRDGIALAQDILVHAQLRDIAEGRKPANSAPLSGIGQAEQAKLKVAIQRLANLDEIVREALY
jgi:CBS domain-containing protein